jgi:hypothetical protein
VGLVLLVAAGGTAAGLLLTGHSHGRTGASSSPSGSQSQTAAVSPTTGLTTSGSSSPSLPAEQQAAQSLSALLSQSAADHSSIVNAVSDVSHCGPNLSQDAQTFQNAATSRQNLLSQLANLPDRSALPGPLLQALTNAWQASVQADQDFAQWAQDEASQTCVPNDQSDPGYQAATGPDNQATADKKAFVSLWNPIAAQYGLATYQWDQL